MQKEPQMKIASVSLVIALATAPALPVLAQTPGGAYPDTTRTPNGSVSSVPPAGPSHHHMSDNGTKSLPEGVDPSASKEGFKHNTGNVANGPTTPRQTGTRPPTVQGSR
jgi:hypothetical protein